MAGQPQVPAGGIDLGAFKPGDRAKQQAVARQQLGENGLVCACGALVREGVETIGLWTGKLPTAQGAQDGAVTLRAVYCSASCPAHRDALESGLAFPLPGVGEVRAQVIATRAAPPVTWVRDPLSALGGEDG